jgi:hypothetical protein
LKLPKFAMDASCRLPVGMGGGCGYSSTDSTNCGDFTCQYPKNIYTDLACYIGRTIYIPVI